MKIIFGTLITLALAGCSTPGKRNPSSSQPTFNSKRWENKLTCDDGLRIDADEFLRWQIVLFGDAARHFAEAGAFSSRDLNAAGEFVHLMQPEGDNDFVSYQDEGSMSMRSNFDRSNSNYRVRYDAMGDRGHRSTDYVFHKCH